MFTLILLEQNVPLVTYGMLQPLDMKKEIYYYKAVPCTGNVNKGVALST